MNALEQTYVWSLFKEETCQIIAKVKKKKSESKKTVKEVYYYEKYTKYNFNISYSKTANSIMVCADTAIITLDYSWDVFRITRVNKNITRALLHFLVQSDVSNKMSLSYFLIGVRDNALCEFPTQVEIFNLRRRCDWGKYCVRSNRVGQFASFSSPGANLRLCIDFVCNILTQILKFGVGVHTP